MDYFGYAGNILRVDLTTKSVEIVPLDLDQAQSVIGGFGTNNSLAWDEVRPKTDPLDLFTYLCEVGGANAIGRVDMVENRFVGIKSRGIYETPGGTILHHAHLDIEGIAMDREVMRLRDMLTAKLSELIYNGFWFSPEMDFLMAAIDKSQEVIDGTVWLKLYKGSVFTYARTSPSSLYDQDLSSMDIEGGFDQKDSKGFIKIQAVRLMAHQAIMHKHRREHETLGQGD